MREIIRNFRKLGFDFFLTELPYSRKLRLQEINTKIDFLNFNFEGLNFWDLTFGKC